MTTELTTESGMHINPDPKTGAIAAAAIPEELKEKIKDDQPEQTKEAEENEPKDPVDPRKAIMEKIYANRGEQFKRELDYAAAVSVGATVEPIIEDGQNEEKVEPVKEVKTEEHKKEETPKAEVAAPKRSITIGNQQFDLTEAEIEQLAQRTLYAENQLRQPQPQYVQQPQYQQQVQAQQPPAQQGPDRDALKDVARRITYGSEEESAKALADYANLTVALARQSSGPTPEQIAHYATVTAANQIRFENNLGAISSEHADIFQSRPKTIVAADKVGSLRQKYQMLNVPKTDIDLYREACNETRAEFGTKPETAEIANKSNTPVQQVASVNVNPNRVERKRAAPQLPSAVNKVQAMQEQNTGPAGSAVVAAMRKARGQSAG